jgi:hypothetical protein
VFIVIEGADGSGKSSLAKKVVEKLGAATGQAPVQFHKGKPEELTRRWVLHEYAIDIERENFTEKNAVADRWHWGEITYAPLKRPHTCKDEYGLLGQAGWRWVELFLASRGIAQFWLRQPLDIIVSRVEQRGDDFINAGELRQILDLYSSGAEKALALSGVIVPPDDIEALDDVVDRVISIGELKSSTARLLSGFPEYIGVPRPKVLLVGDKRNENKKPSSTILPFMPVDSNSGEFLMTALPEQLWRNVGIVNAADVYGLRLLQLHSALDRPKIVALGRLAERELRNAGLYDGTVVVPHPQYVKRFHHSDKYEYGRAIESFADGATERYLNWILR